MTNQKRKKWLHTPFENKDLPNIGSFFKELYPGFDGYGSMGYFHWKIVANYLNPGIINLVKITIVLLRPQVLPLSH